MGPRNVIKKIALATVLLGGTALTMAAPANAALQLALTINGATFNCVDQAACDTNGAVGVLQTGNTTFNGVSFLGSSQTQLTGGINELTTTSFQITNTTASSINYQFAVGGTGFVGPVTGISESGSGTFTNAIGSNTNLLYFADPTNAQGADTPGDLPGILLAASPTIAATSLSTSVSYNNFTAFSDPDLYSMTMGASGVLTGGGQFTGRSQSEIAVNAVNAPEPGSLALIGAGMVGLGMVKRRRRNGASAA